MRLIGVSRILNEAGLIEAFVRHHAGLLDRHILLDNGSTDGTVEILHALHSEGLPIELHQAEAPLFTEPLVNTTLYGLAVGAGADWVLFLDADELVHDTQEPGGLRAVLDAVPPDIACVFLPLFDYRAPVPQTEHEPHPFHRLVRREAVSGVKKVCVRRIDPARIVVQAGNHDVTVDGAIMAGPLQKRVFLAHFPRRSPAQFAAKAAIGRLKVLAAGQEGTQLRWNWHYDEPFEALKRDPKGWMAEKMADDPAWIVDPVPDRGGALRYTESPDDEARLLSMLLHYAEGLARSHGAILDQKRLVRTALHREALAFRRLF